MTESLLCVKDKYINVLIKRFQTTPRPTTSTTTTTQKQPDNEPLKGLLLNISLSSALVFKY